MTAQNRMYVNDHRYVQKRRPKKKGPRQGPLLLFAIFLILVTGVVALYRYGPSLFRSDPTETTKPGQTTEQTTAKPGQTSQSSSGSTEATSTAATPTPEPTLPPIASNPQLLPAVDLETLTPGTPEDGLKPADRGIVSTIFDQNYASLGSFVRPSPISLINPLDYQSIAGVLTFRGNNFRSNPAFGLVSLTDKTMTQVWTKGIGSLPSSSWSFSWTGTGWTGQPLLVQWSDDVRRIMNLNEEKKNKEDLVEVIYATLDGNIYFLDLDDGQPTREPIKIGAPIKGTPSVDPRGYPILYVGQGDENSKVDGIGFRIFNLIDQSLLLYRNTKDANSYRAKWGACDSSPIIDGKADTLIYPNENGMIYTLKLNTQFDVAAATLSINPEYAIYRYKMDGLANQGIESSMAVYDGYGFFNDNSGILNCVDLNTLAPVWSRQMLDDSDVTPVLDQQGSTLVLYTGTEVDWQKDIIGNYQGDAMVYKIDALTGKILWESSYACWTKNAANYGDDVNGGVMGSPVIGKKNMKDLVIFSFCMTNGTYSGNSVVAFNQANGQIVWEYKMNLYSWSSPVDVYDEAGNGYLIIPDSGSQLHLINGQTGEQVSVLQLKYEDSGEPSGNIESSCAVFGNRLVIGTRGNIIAGVSLN